VANNWLVRAEYLNYNFGGVWVAPFGTSDLTINEESAHRLGLQVLKVTSRPKPPSIHGRSRHDSGQGADGPPMCDVGAGGLNPMPQYRRASVGGLLRGHHFEQSACSRDLSALVKEASCPPG
jgi:hypothetical protein